MREIKAKIADLIERRWFRAGVLVLIIANALILGAETFPGVKERAGPALLVNV